MKNRVILHCDCNSFFASVETVLNPMYKNVPMAVCGSQTDRHGIVLAKNEIAKKYNIKTAETVYSAKKKCPNLVIASPHYDEYVKYSKLVNEIYAQYTDIIEPFGIDESWLDVTASEKIFGSGYEIAEKIRKEIKEKLGLTISVGVSFNKVFAKLGSDYKKPDATTVINKNNFKEIVFPLPVSDLLFVGKKTSKALFALGARTIGDLSLMSEDILVYKFGKMGSILHKYANGLDETPVSSEKDDAKSISNGFTFKHNLHKKEEYRIGIEYLADDIGRQLRDNGQKCTTVSVSIKDEFLQVLQRQRQQSPPTDVSRDIARTAFEIVSDEWSEARPIRMITVSASGLIKSEAGADQTSIFDDTNVIDKKSKNKKRENAVDIIRQKYGKDAIINGAVIGTDIGIYNANKNISDFDK